MTAKSSDLKKEIEELQERSLALKVELKATKSELEARIRNNEQLSNKLIHNLKNPIGSIFSFSEMILENYKEYDPEKLDTHIKILHKSATHSIEILNSFGRYLSSQTKTNSNLDSFRLTDLVVKRITELQNIWGKERISLVESDLEQHEKITASRADLLVILEQLLYNALRFSSDNTEVSVEMKKKDDMVALIVCDQGIGITDENLSKVFDPFYCVNSYDLEGIRCVGLGLTIVKNLVERNNGTIRIFNNPEQGSTVICTFKIPDQ